MNRNESPSYVLRVVCAAAIIVLIAGALALRIHARSTTPATPIAANTQAAPAALVPSPAPLDLDQLEIPYWTLPSSRDWALRYRTNLDLLAPLGTGSANAAVWFKDFTKYYGPRLAEYTAAMAEVTVHPKAGKALPPDHTLLLEAEPWVDQATMLFYPEHFQLDGIRTVIPNLLFQLVLVRSWVARGLDTPDIEAGLEDCRRAVRLGRLLRQDDMTIIQDLVGLACIQIGARGIYDLAIRQGDLETALVASIVVGESAPQRFRIAQKISEVDMTDSLRRTTFGGWKLELGDKVFEKMINMALSDPDQRMRGEPTLGLLVVLHLGTPEQKDRARDILEQLKNDPDPVAAENARWVLETPVTDELLDELYSGFQPEK